MKLKDSSMWILRSDVANSMHKEYIYKDISPSDFATQALALKYTHSKLYRIDIGNLISKTNLAPM
jgi:hypothetical protein